MMSNTAPEWADGDDCHRCRVSFNYIQRKHHCRACGQVFCAQCSNKKSMLPKFGIEKEVRVCEACFDKINSKPSTASTKETDLPVEYLSSSLAQQQQVPNRKTPEEVQEEEELALALALSQSEAEEKEKQKKRMTNAYKINSSLINKTTYSPPSSPAPPSPLLTNKKDQQQQQSHQQQQQDDSQVDPELARYMNRKYWEQREASISDEQSRQRTDVTSPSAPNISSPMPQRLVATDKSDNNDDIENMDEFVAHLRSQVEIFVNRMKSNSSRGRSISNDSFFQNLFMTISTMHSRLLKHIREHDDTRVMYEGLQDKLAQVKDARAALDALREEHRDRLRRDAEEAERLKQMQMAQKLDIMRKKKQEYLQYQRELALQKIQERERELQMRQEQQKQQYIMGSYQPVGNYIGPNQQGSPIHQLHYHHQQQQQPPNNFNQMSPTTNQGLYAYGQGQIGNYPMQNYGMPSINQMGQQQQQQHMMAGMANQQEHQTAQLAGNEAIQQQQQSQPQQQPPQQQGIMSQQIQNNQNHPQMTQLSGPGHQMVMPTGHPSTGPSQLSQIPQVGHQQAPGHIANQINMQHPQGMPTGPQGMPLVQGNIPTGPHIIHSGQGIPSGAQNIPSGPHSIQQGPHSIQQGPHTIQQGPHSIQQGPHSIQQGPHSIQQRPQGVTQISQGQMTHGPQGPITHRPQQGHIMTTGNQGIPIGTQNIQTGQQITQHPPIGNIGTINVNPGHQAIVQGQIPQILPFQPQPQQQQQQKQQNVTTIGESIRPLQDIKTSGDDTAELISFD
ncbi:hepatocyte growth factor-regulated tyrosine kinase substrate isoform X2 [Aphidius gifuensis]|uniref:hepatocyte growth factor-regulated tyrosine kinase substrate isoform X2 n=1 Tax=Aphidius gifuensis TaxID=684658 RepID=UPI001CDD662E|nr:hepatocyte growth factor-regulated tyrosine kinase substrate isoform X2 [Aphidius gifuensis]